MSDKATPFDLMTQGLSVSELAALFGVHRTTVYRWMNSGAIPRTLVHRRVNGRAYFWRFEIELYLQKFDEYCNILQPSETGESA